MAVRFKRQWEFAFFEKINLAPLLYHKPDIQFYVRALETHERHSPGFYDSLIVQAAIDLNCTILYSEDLQSGSKYGKVKVVNPFI